MPSLSLWNEDDQQMLRYLVRKNGFAHVALGLRDVAYEQRRRSAGIRAGIGWTGIIHLLTGIYDHIKEGRPLP